MDRPDATNTFIVNRQDLPGHIRTEIVVQKDSIVKRQAAHIGMRALK